MDKRTCANCGLQIDGNAPDGYPADCCDDPRPMNQIKVANPNTGFALGEHIEFSHVREPAPGYSVRELKTMHAKMHDGDHWDHYHGKKTS